MLAYILAELGDSMLKNDESHVFTTRTGTSASDERDRTIREMIDKDRAATDAKTARLKALRLERERSAPPPPAFKPRRRKAR